jgi:predicted TIM-barrel fold metal-dependent hydrolase
MCLHTPTTRRRALTTVLAALTAALVRARATTAAGPYAGPLVDAHAHLKLGVGPSIDELIRLYDAAGVRGALLFGEPWPLATEARDRYSARIVPFLAEGYAAALHPDSSYANPPGLEQLLAGRFVRGLGEVICRHSAFQLGPSGGYASYPAVDLPADHPALLEAYRQAGRHGAPVTVHQEWWHAPELERALQSAPETTFIWAHAGHGPAASLRPLLERHPNLHADLSARSPWLGPGTVLHGPNGAVTPDWSQLLHAHPDRFLVGLDLFVPAHYQPSYVTQMADYYRGLLGQLDPAVAALIGYWNAERIAPFG